MIYFDPSEGRSGTKVPEIKALGSPLPGLEANTAADLAITKEGTFTKVLDGAEDVARRLTNNMTAMEIAEQLDMSIPAVTQATKLWSATQDGILVQRKSGNDLLGSIPKLGEILEKMQVWTRQPWLLVTGVIRCEAGKVVINERRSDYSYNAIQGAFDSWQERGGFLAILERDDLIPEWLQRKQKKLQDGQASKLIVAREFKQELIGPDDRHAWLTTIMTFPGIGPKTALGFADLCGNLAVSLCLLSDERAPEMDVKPEGFGAITSAKARQRLGLLPGQRLTTTTD